MFKRLLAIMLSASLVISTPVTTIAASGNATDVVADNSEGDTAQKSSNELLMKKENAKGTSSVKNATSVSATNGSGVDNSVNGGSATDADNTGSSTNNNDSTNDPSKNAEPAIGPATNNTTIDGPATNNTTIDGTATEDSTIDGSTTEDSTIDGSTTDDSAMDGTVTDAPTSDAAEGEVIDDATESEDPLSDEDAESESEADAASLDEEASLLPAEENTILLGDGTSIPADYIYDDINIYPIDNFGVIYLTDFSADTKEEYDLALAYGSDIYVVDSVERLSDYLGEDVSETALKNYRVETCLYSDGTYTVVTGDESPLNISFGTEDHDLNAYATANSTFPDGKYYLRFTFDFPDHIKSGKKIEKLYPIIKAPKNETLYDSKDAAYAAVRDIIRNRTNNLEYFDDTSNHFDYDNFVYDRIYVESTVFPEGSILLKDICDFEAERDGMAPDEGDYMFNLLGNRIKRTFYYEAPSFADQEGNIFGIKHVDGKSYYVYEVYLPVITTKAEEEAVDAAVENLMASTFSDVKDGTNKDKIKKVYDYVTKHVSGTVSGAGGSDRTYPPYHTAYHALIKGNGTCESYAQLFTRLTRELGVPSKVIMGMDSANHTYNIVDAGDGYWYYIDCSAGIYLTDSKNFKRAPEQERFTTPKFVENYLKKLKGGTTIDVDTVKVLDKNGTEVFESVELAEVNDYVENMLKYSEDGQWTIRLDSNWTIELDYSFSFSKPDNVILDLNSHTLICKNVCCFDIGAIKNGTIQAGYKDNIFLHSGNLYFDKVALENVTVKGISGSDQLVISPRGEEVVFRNATLKKLDVLINYDYDDYYFDSSDVVVDGTLTVDSCYFFANTVPEEDHPIIMLTQNSHLEFAGTTIFGGWDYGEPPYDNFQGSVPNRYFQGKPIEFVPAEDRFFASGEVIATYSGTLKKITNSKGTQATAALTDYVDLEKTSSHKDPSDTTLGLTMMEKSLLFIKTWLTVGVLSDAEEESMHLIGQFVKWSDAISAIDKDAAGLKAADYKDYIIELTSNGDIMQKMTFPKKAKTLSIYSEEGQFYTLTHRGDLAPTLPVMFADMALTTPASMNAKLTLGGNTVIFDEAYSLNTYSQVSGSAKSKLYLLAAGEGDRYVFSSKGAVSVGNLVTNNYRIESLTGGITVQADAVLEETALDAETNVAIKNLRSYGGNNSIAYGAAAKNTFKITGTVSADGSEIRDVTATDDSGRKSVINSCAVSVTNKYMEKTGYLDTKDLVTTAKAPACFFVVDKHGEDDGWNVKYTTRKVKTGIRINTGSSAGTDGAVILSECNSDGEKLYTLGYFANLAGAFAEIKAIGSANARYLVTIDGTKDYGKKNSALDTGNISTPTQAAALFITSLDGENPAYLHVGGGFTIGSPVTLKGVRIAGLTDKKGNAVKLNINLGKHRLTLDDVDLLDGAKDWVSGRIGKITGSGVNGTSALEIRACAAAYDFVLGVNGNLANVGELCIRSSEAAPQSILVRGKTNIGKVSLDGSSNIIAYATVKRDKTGAVTSVTSPIAIGGKVEAASKDDTLNVVLLEKTATGGKEIDLAVDGEGNLAYTEPAFNINKPGFQVVKAPKAGSKHITFDFPGRLMEKKGSLYLVSDNAMYEHGAYRLYNVLEDPSYDFFGEYATFADVVWDINNMKNKEAAYVVSFDGGEGTDGEGRPAGMATAEKFVMPKATALRGLVIEAQYPYLLKCPAGTKISFTCDTTIHNIQFVTEGTGTKKISLNLGGNKVRFVDTNCAEGFGDITGNGTGKNSELDVAFTISDRMLVTGNLNNVCKVFISGGEKDNVATVVPELVVYGKTNVGSLFKGAHSVFKGSAAVKLNKTKTAVASVTSNVTIVKEAGSFTSDEAGSRAFEPEFDLSLLYKNGNAYVPVLGTEEGSFSPADVAALDGDLFKLMNSTYITPGRKGEAGKTVVGYTGYTDGYSVVKSKNVILLKRAK